MNVKEIEAVSKLSASKRFEYFIKKVVDYEGIWGLYKEEAGWVSSEDDDGNVLFPFWPKKRICRPMCTR